MENRYNDIFNEVMGIKPQTPTAGSSKPKTYDDIFNEVMAMKDTPSATPQSVQPQSNTPEIAAPEHSYQETIPTSSILGGEQKREGVFAESLDKQMQKEHLSKMSTDPAYRDDYFRGLGYQDAEDYRKRTADKLEETLKNIGDTLPESLVTPRSGIEALRTGADDQFSRLTPQDKATLRNFDKVRNAIKTLRSNNFWSGLGEGFDLKDIATLGFAQVGDNVAAINALNKAHRGEQLNDMEKALVDAWKLGQQVEGEIALLGGRSLASNIGRGVGESLPFVTEMIATGGAAAAATKGISKAIAKNALKTSAKELLEEGSQQVAKKLTKDRIVSGLQKGGLKLAESAVGSAVRVPISGGVYKNYTTKRLDQFISDDGEIKKYVTPAWKDALKAGFETFAEYQSEDVGNWIGAPINSLGSRFAHSGFGKMLRLDQIADYKGNAGIEWLRDQAKITNLVGETLGEAYGDALINTFEKDKDGWRQMLTKEYWWQLAGVSSILPLATSIPNVLSSGQIDYSRRVAELDKIKTNALTAIKNSDLRTQLTKAAAAPTIAQRSEILKGINWKDTAISKADGFNAVKYINATTAFDISEGEASETERLARFFPVATYLEEREYMGLDGKEPTNDVVEIADKKGNVYTVQSGDIDSEDPNTILKAKDGQGRLWDIPLGDVASTSRGSIRDKVAEAYAMMFGTQAKQQSLDKLQSKINEAVAVGVSNEDIHNIIEENGLTQFENGDLITLVDGRQGEIIDFDKGRYLISTIDQNGEVLLDSYGINDIVQPEMTAADVAMQKAEPTAEVVATTQPAVEPIPIPEQQAIEGVIVEAERVIDEQIDASVNVADGNIYNCILEDDSEVVIRNGNIVLTENGEIDAAKSDSTIVVEYPDGRKQTISPQRIAYIASAENAQQAKENAHEQLRNVVTEQERLTNINMAINNGDPVVTTDGRQGVVSATKDGTLTLTDTEGNTSAITFEDIADVAAPTEEVAETAPEAVEPEVAPTTEVTAEAPVNEPAVSDKAAEIPEVEIPRLKNGEVDYNSIDNAELFSSLLVQDLGSKEDALEAVKTSIDGYSAEYAKLNEETKKEKDITKRVAKTKESAAIARRLEVLNQVQEILSPKPEVATSEPTVSASATPEVAPTPEEVVEPTDPKDTYRNRIAEWVNKLGINVRVLESIEEVELSSAKAVIEQGQRVVGWYNVTTGEVCLYMPNIDSIADVDSTIVHEVVAHKGMAIMLGNDGFNALCDRVWDMMSEEARSTYINYPGVGGDTRKAADEYIAHLAERVDLDANEQNIWQEIINFFREALSKLGFEVNITDEVLADLIRASYHNLAAQNLQKQGAEVDTTRGDVLYAVKDVLTGKDREQAIADLMKVTGRSRKTVEQYLKAEESLAQIILNEDNVAFLDLQVDESVPSIWNNSDYPQGTVEFSNICRKRLPLTMIYQRLQKEFPNTVFDATTLETIRGVLKNNGIDVACGLCFVEDRRQLLGEIGQEFIDAVRGEHITTNANQIAALEALKDSGDNYIPNLYELLTLDGMKELRRDHPEVAAAFVRYNNARGMQAGRLFQAYSAYHREILDYSAAKVKSINDNGGLRIFSFSDFEAHHLIDLVQVLTDCAAKGIKVQGYTKVPEFARAVKDTKMKLNRSLIAKGSGVVDENYTPKEGEAISPNVINGKRLLLDTVEGIDVNNADFFDSTSSSSVGNILVGINDEQIRLAMEDPFVDYIIPFHTGIKRETLIQKGIGEWVNYKNDQVEKVVDANGKLKKADKHINIYTDVLSDKTRTERQFVNKYLKICRERGYIPKFPQFLNKNSKGEYIYTKGYYKFLLDFKMFDQKGYILPQEVVVPIFDNDLNKRILEEYVEGERTAAPNEEVYNEVKEALELENVRFRFIGEKGAANLDKAEEATIRLDNLSIARDMESAGKDAKAIKMATGWERGADDKWRYEEADTITAKTIRGLKGAGANKIREARSKRISDLDKYAYITNIVGIDRLYDDKKINATSWPDAQKKVWLDIYNIYKDNRDAAIEDYRKARKQATTLINLGKGEFMLYEVLGENDSLFKAYPQMRNVKLMIKPYKGGKTLGGFNRLNNTIEIVDFRGIFENDKGEGSASTAVHEIQHIIQSIEGFARGGNSRMEDPNKARNKASIIEKMTENRDKSERELESLYNTRNDISDKMKEWYDAHPDAMYEDALKDPDMVKLDEKYNSLGHAIRTAQDNLTFFAERLASMEDFDTSLGEEGYHRLAGEVEARNVERRRQMTPEERRQTLASETADVAKEDQIVLEDSLIGVSAKQADEVSYSDVMFSIKEMDVPYLDAVKRGDMKTARRMVNEAAEMAGYTTDESWKKNHRAPRKGEDNVNPFNTEELVPEDYWTHPEWYTQIRHNSTDRESYYNMKSAIDKYKRLVAEGKQEEADKVTVTMYRGVDRTANKKESKFRNGDWITPSREYALLSAPYGKARVISQDVLLKDVWWDGNSINEWGYDDGLEYTYKDTKNNRKLLDAVTYDDNGNIIPLSQRFNPRKEDVRFKIADPERERIEREAKSNDTWLKAPNGQPTNLTPEQWVTVRTKAFKKWFGDWLKAARIEKLRNRKPIDVIYDGQYELTRKGAKEWMRENIKGEYTNLDTNEIITISNVGINEVTSHGSQSEEHLKSLSTIPQLIENAIFIEELPNRKDHDKYDSYRYYVCGLKIDDVDYTAKIVVGVKGDSKYYDHRLTQIEKGNLIDNLNSLSNAVAENSSFLVSDSKDTKLIEILQTNSSKVVDENGEPKVVYNGSKVQHYQYDGRLRTAGQSATNSKVSFFTDNKSVAERYGAFINEVFLNIRNPYEIDYAGAGWQGWSGAEDGMQRMSTDSYADLLANGTYGSTLGAIIKDYGRAEADHLATGKVFKEGIEPDGVIAYNVADPMRSTLYIVRNAEAKELSRESVTPKGVETFTKLGKSSLLFDSQIKSATDNIGTFDAANDDIRFSIAEQPIDRILDQKRSEFAELQSEYEQLLQNRDNNPNFESALNEWRDRKVKVLQDYLYAFAEDLGIDQYVVIDIFNTRGVREEYGPIVDLWMPGISEEERQKALDILSNPETIGVFAPQNGVLIDVSHSDDSELKVYEEALVHEFSHYDDYHMKSDEDLFNLYVENEELIKKFEDLSPYVESGASEEVLATELLSAAMGRIYRRGAFAALVNGSITPEEAVDVLKYSKPLMREFLIEKLNRYKYYAEQAAERRRTTEASYVYSNQSGWNDERGVYISDGTGRRSTVEDEEFVEVDIQDLIDRGEEFEILVPENARFSIKSEGERASIETSAIEATDRARTMWAELEAMQLPREEIAKRVKEATGVERTKNGWKYILPENRKKSSWRDNVAPIDVVAADFEHQINRAPQIVDDSLTEEELGIISDAKANGTWLKAPNGAASNLPERQWVTVRTKAFKEWAGDWENDPENSTKFLDVNGEPILEYFQAPNEFVVFAGDDQLSGGAFGQGVYTTPYASHYRYGKRKTPLFLNARNPLRLEYNKDEKVFYYQDNKWDNSSSQEIVAWAKSNGFDAVAYQNGNFVTNVVFSADQITSAHGESILNLAALRIQDMSNKISKLYSKLRDSKDVAHEVAMDIKNTISKELIDIIGKQDFNKLITILDGSVGSRDKAVAVRQLNERVAAISGKALLKNFNKLMGINLEKLNPRGISMIRWIDGEGRLTIKTFKDAIANGITAEQLREEFMKEWKGGEGENFRNPNSIFAAITMKERYEEYQSKVVDIENIETRISNLREKNSKLFQEAKQLDYDKAKRHRIKIARNKRTIDALLAQKVKIENERNLALLYLNSAFEKIMRNGRLAMAERKMQEAIHDYNIIKTAMKDCYDESNPTRGRDDKLSEGKKILLGAHGVLFNPAYSMNTTLRVISVNVPGGEGRFYHYFADRYLKAQADFYAGYNSALKEYTDKAKAIFGKDYAKILKDSAADSDIIITRIKEGSDEEEENQLTYGEAMYLYMVNKMIDGQVKIRSMGISEENMNKLTESLPAQYRYFADWIQAEFLPKLREKYNQTYIKKFGISMAEIDNYCPLKIQTSENYQEFDGSGADGTYLPTAMTGSVIARKNNTKPIDVNSNALEVIRQHFEDMEHWDAYTFVVSDMNVLLSNTAFRRMLDQQHPGMHEKLKELSQIAAGKYRSKASEIEIAYGKLNSVVATSKISFRQFTALKQLLSYPAFMSYSANLKFLGKLAIQPLHAKENFKWALENSEIFKARWESRSAGNEKLANVSALEWSKLVQGTAKAGMFSNASIDALVCATGAKAIYDFELESLIKGGMPEEKAHSIALNKAVFALNETQQSSEPLFLSKIQVGKEIGRVALSTFMNSNFSYLRKCVEAIVQLSKRNRDAQIANRIDYYKSQGTFTDEEIAKLAEKDVKKANRKALRDLFVFNHMLNVLWEFGGYIFLYAGGDDDDRDEIHRMMWISALLAPIRNLPLGNLIANLIYGFNTAPMALNEVQETIKRIRSWWNEEPEAYNETAFYIALQTASTFGIGVDLVTFDNIYQGVAGMFRDGVHVEDVMNLLNAPQSQRKLLAGKPKEGESLEEYQKRMAFIYKRTNDHTKKDLARWEREYIAGQQRKLLLENGYSSVDMEKSDKRYNEIRKVMGITRSGNLNEDARYEFKHHDPEEQELIRELLRNTRIINAKQKQLERMVDFNDSYLQLMLDIEDLRKEVIEKYDKSNK